MTTKRDYAASESAYIYNVMAGLPGCMPNFVESYPTEEYAREAAVSYIESLFDDPDCAPMYDLTQEEGWKEGSYWDIEYSETHSEYVSIELQEVYWSYTGVVVFDDTGNEVEAKTLGDAIEDYIETFIDEF